MAADEIFEKIQAKEDDWADLFTRMDFDRDLYHNAQFQLTDKDGRPMKNVENVTLNDSMTFGRGVVSALNAADMQTIVESKEGEQESDSVIEEFFRLLFQTADERLSKRDISGLRFFSNEMACLRGRIVTRVLLSGDGAEFVPDLTPCDPRFTVYQMGLSDLAWVAVKSIRDAELIEEQYGKVCKSERPECWDFWNREMERVYVGSDIFFEQPNKSKRPPFAITSCSGSLLQDSIAFQHQAESIYGANRYLYNPMNRISSILATEVGKLLKPPQQFKNRKGPEGKLKAPPYGEGVNIPMYPDESIENMPRADLTQAGRLIIALLEQRIQRGGYTAIDYGNLTFPLSAVAIKGLQGAKDQVYLPRLQALAVHYRDIARLVRQQYIDQGFEAELGDDTNRKVFPASQLAQDYNLFFRFNALNPEMDAANYTFAGVAKEWLSDQTIMTTILQVDDPIGEMNKKWAEMGPKINPRLAMFRICKALLDTGRDAEAEILANEAKLSIDQIRSGKIGGEKPIEVASGGGKPLVPLLPQGGGVPSRGRPAQEQILENPGNAAAVGSEAG
jgi:hypothetical protein